MPMTDEKDDEWTAEELNPSVDDIRRIVEEHRLECGERHSFGIVDRALRWLDGTPCNPFTFMADRIFIESLTPDEIEESPWVVAAAKILYRAIDTERGACPVT
jgi:hypothetical protein